LSVQLSVSAGTLVTVTATFNSEVGDPTDPSTITLRFAETSPGYVPTVWVYGGAGSITRTSTGIYVAELDTTSLPGTWEGAWIGTGACQVAQPFRFQVTPLPV
jgi:hypothetical protein